MPRATPPRSEIGVVSTKSGRRRSQRASAHRRGRASPRSLAVRLARAARVHTPVLGPSRHGPRQAGACQEPRGFPGGGRVGVGRKQGSIARFRDMTRSPRGLRAGRVKTLGCREGGCGVPVRPESSPRRNPSATGAVASPAADARHGGGRRVPLRADTLQPPTPSGGVGGGDPVTPRGPRP